MRLDGKYGKASSLYITALNNNSTIMVITFILSVAIFMHTSNPHDLLITTIKCLCLLLSVLWLITVAQTIYTPQAKHSILPPVQKNFPESGFSHTMGKFYGQRSHRNLLVIV